MEISDSDYMKILKKQFKLANVPESYLKKLLKMPKEKQGDWYRKYSWTEDKQEEFKQWLIKFIIKKFPTITQRYAETCASFWLLEFGWTTLETSEGDATVVGGMQCCMSL